MLQKRIIPVLLLSGGSLVKTQQFRSPTYVGDPCNTALIFNELEADELILLDISPTTRWVGPDFETLRRVSSECFMPLAYGGGISNCDQAEKILNIGFEKIVINSSAIAKPTLISDLAQTVGSQAVVVSMDYRKNTDDSITVFTNGGRERAAVGLLEWCKRAESLGAGEIMVTSISMEGMWGGYDIPSIKEVAESVSVPVIAHGGAGSIADIIQLFHDTEVLGAGVGSMFVFQKRGMGVLVNMPQKKDLTDLLEQSQLQLRDVEHSTKYDDGVWS